MIVGRLIAKGKSPEERGKFDLRASLGALIAASALLMVPGTALGQQKAVEVIDHDEVEISCSAGRDEWEPILFMGPIDAAEEEASVSKDIKVTLKYLFLQGSQRRRVTLLVKWTQNAKLTLEVNPKQLCDSKGTTGVRTTISGQTQVPDGKAALPKGYIRILPEELD